ncbi:MAG: hypothetical protein H7328_09025 [Bdellovibrio sp.]|nr:hypothetical protein [Bdellovibrio sp.]
MKKIIHIFAFAFGTTALLTNCGIGNVGRAGSALTSAGKMSAGLGGSVSLIQNVGGTMDTNGALAFHAYSNSEVNAASAATKCTEHAGAGFDGNNGQPVDGNITDNEKYASNNAHYALQNFYCLMAAKTSGPESVAGSVQSIKTVVCAVERTVGTLPFDGSTTRIGAIIIDSACATPAEIADMGGTITIPGGIDITSALNPTFAEMPGNTFYSHGIRIASVDGTSLKFIVLAKFDPAVSGNPVDSGDFEFATYGTGTAMQGTAIETTAGKISGGSATTKNLWYEARLNRVKSGTNDLICKPGDATAGSCGFTRHIRLKTNISFLNGEISDVSNLSGIMTDGGDPTGSSQSAQRSLITATGSYSTGLTGKVWTNPGTSPVAFGPTDTVSAMTAGPTTCLSANQTVTATCPMGFPAAYTPSEAIKIFFLPANTTTWINDAASHGGIGHTAPTNAADEQFAL